MRLSVVRFLVSLALSAPGFAQEPSRDAIDRAIEALGGEADTDPEGRTAALAVLRARADAAVPRLIDAMAARRAADRRPLAEALTALADAGVPGWCAAIATGPTERRIAAIRAFEVLDDARAPDPRLVDTLIEAMVDPDEKVQWMSAYSLGYAGTWTVPALERRLRDDRPAARLRAAILLGRVRYLPRIPWPAVLAGTRDPNAYYRLLAYQQCADVLPDEIDLWRRALDDDHRWVRRLALGVAREVCARHPECEDDLVRFLQRAPPAAWSEDAAEEWRLHTSLLRRLARGRKGRMPIAVLRAALARRFPGEANGDAACEAFIAAALRAIAATGVDAIEALGDVQRQLDRRRLPAPTMAAALEALVALPPTSVPARLDRLRDALAAVRWIEGNAQRAAVLAPACRGLIALGPAAAVAAEDLRALPAGTPAVGAVAAALIAIDPGPASHERAARVLIEIVPTPTSHHDLLCDALAAAGPGALCHTDALLALHGSRDVGSSVQRAAARAAVALWPWSDTAALLADGRAWPALAGVIADVRPERAVALLAHPTVEVRSAVANALIRGHHPGASAALLALAARDDLPDPRPVVVAVAHNAHGAAAVAALDRFWPRAWPGYLVPALERFGKRGVASIRAHLDSDSLEAATHAFVRLGPVAADAVPELVAWIGPLEDPKLRRRVLHALAHIGPSGQSALERLHQEGTLDDSEILDALQAAATGSPHPGVRRIATDRLVARGHFVPGLSAKAFDRHRPLAGDEASQVLQLATWMQLDPEPADPLGLMLSALAMRPAQIRLIAVRTMPAKIADRAVCTGYLRLLEDDPSPRVREAARAALAR